MSHTKDAWKYMNLDPSEPTRFSLESFAQYHKLPGPTSPNNIRSLTKILISRGFADRGGYWSKKAIYKPRAKQALPKPIIPSYIKIPRGSFCILDFLLHNNMNRYPENFVWARQYLAKHPKVERLPGSWRYACRDRRNKLPAVVTGAWRLPNTPVFTTYQFQITNNIYKASITAEQWASAVEFLTHHGFTFNPKWKRWMKQA